MLPVQCIICRANQYVRESGSGKRKVEKLMTCETKSGGQLLNAAMMKQDERLLLDIRDKDLVAIEANYHKSCYLRYTKVVHKPQTKGESSQLYEKSYQSFCCKVIEERIVKGKEILRLTKLNKLFKKEVQDVEGIDASSYKSGRLKARLRRSYPVLCFCKPSRQSESGIVFVETLDIEEVVEDVVKDVTSEDSESSESILDQTSRTTQPFRELFHAAQEMKASMSDVKTNTTWPPIANDMTADKINELIPTKLYNFLAWCTGVSEDVNESEKALVPDESHRRLLAVAQDLIYIRSKGKIASSKAYIFGNGDKTHDRFSQINRDLKWTWAQCVQFSHIRTRHCTCQEAACPGC